MATAFGIKNPSWDLTKSRHAETDEYPLMGSPGPVMMIIALYLLFVLKVGPSFMRKREAFRLKYTLILYNAVQVVISVYLAQKYFRALWQYGLFPEKCLLDTDDTRQMMIEGIWLYFAAKVTELLDTVFFVLRKKDNQVSFLHLYHHFIMMTGTWAFLKYAPSDNVVFIGFFNSLVHVFMYTYYGLAAFGPHVAKYLTWKKYMTSFQLLQFVSVFFQYLASLKFSECPPSKGVAIFFTFQIIFFLVLFSNFYKQSYTTKKSQLTNGVSKLMSNGKTKEEKTL